MFVILSDSRFQVIHLDNQGVSEARNVGLFHSKAQYIYFIDSDDYLHPQILELLYNTLITTKCSLAMTMGVRTFIGEDPITTLLKQSDLTYEIINQSQIIERLFGLAEEEIQYQVVWNKLYSKDIIKNIRFKNTASEDTDFNIRIYLSCKDMAIINNIPMYYWIQRNNSITHQINKRFVDNIESYYHIYNYIPIENQSYRGKCLFKLYKRMLNVRYYAYKNKGIKDYTKELFKFVHSIVFYDFFKNKTINLIYKIGIIIFIYIPYIYDIVMIYYEKKTFNNK